MTETPVSEKARNLAFAIGYDIFDSLTLSIDGRKTALINIQKNLSFLGLRIDSFPEEIFQPEIDGGFALQPLLEKILAGLRENFDEGVASYFKLPVNVFVAMAHLPIVDFSNIESPLQMIVLSDELRSEFFNLRKDFSLPRSNPMDYSIFLTWLEKVKIHVLGSFPNSAT